MTFGEVKDVVREHFGRIGWPTVMLDLALDGARRDIESEPSGFYWMRASIDFSTVVDTPEYPIGLDAAVNEINFKDIIALHTKRTADTMWSEVGTGIMTLEQASLAFGTDETNMSTLAVLNNNTLVLYPTPDAIYNMRLYYWKWTSNPAGNTLSDELTSHFPDALIYGALIRGCEQYEKNNPDADRWRKLFTLEVAKIHRHSLERERVDRGMLIPMTGPYAMTRRTSVWQ